MAVTYADPRVEPQKWARQFLEWLAFQENESYQWYQALVERIAIGVVNCDELQRYNRSAEEIYYYEAWLWNLLDPFFDSLRAQGAAVPLDPPLPKLIGTIYNVYGGKRQHTKFQVSVPCSPQGLADAAKLNIWGQPQNCAVGQINQDMPAGGSITAFAGAGGNLGMVEVEQLGSYQAGHGRRLYGADLGDTIASLEGWPLVAGAAVIVIGIWVGGHYVTAGIDRIAGMFDGATVARINQQMNNRRIKVDRERAEMVTACVRERMARLYPAGTQPTAAQLAEVDAMCQKLAGDALPDRPPPFAEPGLGFGSVLIILGILGSTVGVTYYVTRAINKRTKAGRRGGRAASASGARSGSRI